MTNLTDLILEKKRLIIALGLVILAAEGLFFLPSLKKGKGGAGQTVPLPPVQKVVTDAKLLLQTEKESVAVGENFTVALVLATKSQKAAALDAVVTFDPALLKVVAVEKTAIFNEYPQLKFNNAGGKISVSATTSLDNEEGVAAGEVAKVTFSALKSGKGKINFVFKPGETTDSNVVAAGGTEDILGEVENLSITIK